MDREAKRVYMKEWGQRNAERRRAYKAANLEKARIQAKARRAANPEPARIASKAWRSRNLEQSSATNRAWYLANRERKRQTNYNRRARKHGVPFVEVIEFSVVYERDGGVCQICGEPIGAAEWHIDHVKPLARGGEHSYANVQLAHAHCNHVKQAKF